MWRRGVIALALFLAVQISPASAQEQNDILKIATVTRAPFSMIQGNADVGFSIDLWEYLAKQVDLDYALVRYDTFPEMLGAVESGEADAAIANISITLERERKMDFTLPFFEAGVQILLTSDDSSVLRTLRSIFSPVLLFALIGGFIALLGMGMLMWFFERKRHVMFGSTVKEAAFSAFWWALLLIIAGEYVDKKPRTPMGRLFGVLMVIASLFVVSIFVANITAAVTVNALNDNVHSLEDLEGMRIGTTEGSTTSAYLDLRGIAHRNYSSLDDLLEAAFDDKTEALDAVVFDGPILAYFMRTEAPAQARLIDRTFKREDYGIALTQDSPLREPLNRALLRASENGVLDELNVKWFGAAYSNN
jgi:polar amino acid transport system substrate-binding protein